MNNNNKIYDVAAHKTTNEMNDEQKTHSKRTQKSYEHNGKWANIYVSYFLSESVQLLDFSSLSLT